MAKYDFSGWATKFNLKCSDGRTITPDAFTHMDGVEVPLVWNHQHNGVDNVLGKARLEHRAGKGIYAYCTLNDSDSGKAARQVLNHGDVTHLSIWANNLKEHMKSVLHGNIREVSLVLAGANPGAVIENICLMHGDDMYEYEQEAYIYTDEPFELYHSDSDEEVIDDENEEIIEKDEEIVETDDVEETENEDEKGDEPVLDETTNEVKHAEGDKPEAEETIADVFNTFTDKQKKVVYAMIGQALADKKEEPENKEVKHADDDKDGDDSDETVADVFDTLSEKQKKVVYAMIGQALEEAKNNNTNSEGGNNDMKHNVFEGQETEMMDNVLSHSEMTEILEDAKRAGSLKEAVLAHGIEDLDVMFPDHKSVNNEPEFIKRDNDWVTKVLAGVHHTPFSRIKTVFADITAAEARAKGYQKGNLKIEEVFKLLKRVTGPTTVYKKQKLDRDDILDLSFDHLPWLKREIRMMLDEEIARAFLIGDGRDPVEEADDKINEECIRPIWKMEDLFTVKVPVEVTAATTGAERAKAFITAVVKSRKEYKGSGNPAMFMPEDLLTECLLLEDKNGRTIYETEDKLRARLRVSEIIPVPVMEGDAIKRVDKEGKNFELAGLYVNLKDYNVGTDKGGEVNFFDDFDIDYNQMKYLMETRCSGTLTKPYSAVAIEFTTTEAEG